MNRIESPKLRVSALVEKYRSRNLPAVKPKTSTARVQKHRAKIAERRALMLAPKTLPAVPAVSLTDVTLHETPTVQELKTKHPRFLIGITFLAALALAAVSAGFSIVGLTSIFAGAFWPVVALGAAFEGGKLVAAAWIGRARFALSVALSGLVLALMTLNSIGVYGFLAKAHIATALAGDLAVAAKAAGIDAKLEAEQAIIADIDRRIADRPQIETKTKTDRGAREITQTAVAREPIPAELERKRSAALDALTDLKVQKANIEVERKTAEAELGPVKYLAALLGTTDEVTMRYFILVVALLLDPAAVLLLIAATRR